MGLLHSKHAVGNFSETAQRERVPVDESGRHAYSYELVEGGPPKKNDSYGRAAISLKDKEIAALM